MTNSQIRRIVNLHEKATLHANEYKRLLEEGSTRSKALRHLRKAERLFGQVSDLIREWDCNQ